ncbi:cell division protein FtsQ/DivIB [Pacificimonas flava]|uniref:Cell division protein FtsQ n=1 Tax=Pacificimonas flava TaxID=1234595 RepID=M2S9S0_9SPHN|nr:cell division protein FtsQ/DivIB [Pacificimonas flava]EMD82130.1 Cell division protein FtsQ [Pacificimonas flava]MBB5280390.1 cell division protein FtsQ [Pacificimonas flava]
MSDRVVLKRGQGRPSRAPKRKAPARRKAAGARTEAAARTLGLTIISVAAAVLTVGAAWLYDLPGKLWLAAANVVAGAGFEVRDVEVTGTRYMARLPLYTAALDGASDSMLLVDLDDVKRRLENLPWVAEASVARVLPDRLLIDVTEREPAAIWQNNGEHYLIDAGGRVITRQGMQRFAGLPLIVDEGANRQASELLALLGDYPAVADQLRAATWRGERRWDLTLDSGETILLPEGDANARRALDSFLRLDRESSLTGRGFASLDFRVPGQMAVRVSKEPGAGLELLKGTEI